MPRTFIGWPLPEELRLRLEIVTTRLRKELPHGSWTRPETYHITFAFLGDQSESTIERLADEITTLFRTVSPARVSIGEAGFFPSPRRPRVGWLGLADFEPVEEIARLTRVLLVRERVEFDQKPFKPHLTLVRPKGRWSRDDVDRFVSSLDQFRGDPILVDSVTLFESRLGSGGARHVPRVVADCEAR